MSDPMMGAPAPVKPNAISRNMSAINPADAAMQAQTGKISKDMTTGQYIEKVIGVPLNAPVTAFIGKLREQLQNRNMAGKSQSMSASPSAPSPAGPPAPTPPPGPAAGAPAGGGGRMAQLMSSMQGGK